LRELRELSDELKRAADPSQLQEQMLAVGWTLASMQTGVSMRELARQLGGGNFFHEIDFGTDSDWDEDAPALKSSDGEHASLGLEEWERRCLAVLESPQPVSDLDPALDLWISTARIEPT
jgi:hypothetical protein